MRRLITIVSVAWLWAVVGASCGSCATERSRRLVSQRGIEDAEALAQRAPAMTRMQLESYLLRIRSNEHDYRVAGKEALADAYIEAFEATLAHSSDSLAALILGPEQARMIAAADYKAYESCRDYKSDRPGVSNKAEAADSIGEPVAEPIGPVAEAVDDSEPEGLDDSEIEETSPWELSIK